jgi:hypothetical protein
VRQQFEDIERPALMALPRERFANFHEAKRAVSRDGHLEVDKAFYSAPAEYIGRRVWVRWDAHLVRVFNDQWRQIALHSKAEPGRFRTDSSHIPSEKVSTVERGTNAILRQISMIGPQTRAWSELVIQSRGVHGIRVLVGLRALAGKHTSEELEQACSTAVSHGACRLRSIRNLLKRPATQSQQALSFIEEHPIIRPLSDYSVDSLNAFRKERNHEHVQTGVQNGPTPGAGPALKMDPPRQTCEFAHNLSRLEVRDVDRGRVTYHRNRSFHSRPLTPSMALLMTRPSTEFG